MKNVMKKLAGLLMVLSVALFAGCSDSSDRANEAPQTAKTYTVSGKISIGNAVPADLAKSLANSLTAANSNARTATTDFDMDKITCGAPKWEVKATNTSGEIYGEVNSEEMLYSINLPTGTWDLELSLLGETDTNTFEALLYYEEKELEVPGDSGAGPDIFLSPKNFSTNINGALDLTITDGTTGSKIKSVICSLEYLTRKDSADFPMDDNFKEKLATVIASLKKPEVSSGKVKIECNDIPAGCYEATFTFKDEKDNTLYECKEIITVFSGWTTDTWFGTSPYMKDGAFVITSELIDGYGTETVTASQKTVLYEAYSETTTTADGDVTTSGYKYYLADSADTNISALTANVTTTKNEINSFCFDTDGNVYVLGYDTGNNKYVISSTKYADISIDSNITSLNGIAIDKATNILYAYYGMQQLYNVYKFTNLVSDGSAEAYETISNISFSDIDEWFDNSNSKLVVNNGMIYGFANGPKTFYKVDLAESSPVAEKINLDLDYSATVTDMLYQDGAVYILLRLVSSSSGIYSTGALLRYDVKFGTVKTLIGLSDLTEPVDLSGVKLYTSVYVPADDTRYQCYTDSSLTTPFYAPADFTWTANEEMHTIFSSLYTPSLLDKSNATLSKTGFYGPVKFVAIKPRKLVIADDGLAFYTDEDGVLSYKNVNRVVTVDLESFAITNSTETDAIFGENNSARLYISFENDSDFQYEFNSSSDVFPNLEAGNTGKVYYSDNTQTQGVAPGDSFEVGIPCAD